MSSARPYLGLLLAFAVVPMGVGAACGRSGLDDLPAADDGTAGTGGTDPGAAGSTAGTGAAGTPPSSHPPINGAPLWCPCSRAPGGPLTSEGVTCPAGTGRSKEATIGTMGGSLELSTATGKFVLGVPPGALSSSTSVRVTELGRPTPAGYTDYSAIYEISPGGLQLRQRAPVTILWNFKLAPGSAFTSPAEVAIYSATSPNGPWSRLEDSVVNAGSSTATLDRFAYLFVGYPTSLDDPRCR